eukprot:TRINITY_DN20862_c0_g1_i3.p1 TRINITY_DN20862_c0_g1~~TRINITY_DN20862_c0_g1_i3.p1  ORF type:complete len:106 (+),score=13.55 TRINITY_DN20862_c0_g1_i3:76-393(+)
MISRSRPLKHEEVPPRGDGGGGDQCLPSGDWSSSRRNVRRRTQGRRQGVEEVGEEVTSCFLDTLRDPDLFSRSPGSASLTERCLPSTYLFEYEGKLASISVDDDA